MPKLKGLPHNTGRLNAYSYHAFDNQPVKGGKVQRFVLADSWYPVPAQEQELVILRKIYALCGGIDGNPYHINSYDNLSRLFLTSDYILRDGRFFENEYVNYRTEERYKSFVREGYLVDEPTGRIAITFTGMKRMQSILDAQVKTDVLHQVSLLDTHVKDLIDGQNKQNDSLLLLRTMLLDYMTTADENKRFTVSDGIGVASDITTTISNVPAVLSMGKKIVENLPIITATIRALIAAVS